MFPPLLFFGGAAAGWAGLGGGAAGGPGGGADGGPGGGPGGVVLMTLAPSFVHSCRVLRRDLATAHRAPNAVPNGGYAAIAGMEDQE
jgi:hypothetical protein